MALENMWVTYLNRSYKSIKASILSRMQTEVPEITDHSESNIFVIIINSFAGLVEQLNYYIDNIARESFLPTARRYSSIIKLTRLIDYRVRAKIGSVVDLRITAMDSSGQEVQLDHDEVIASGLIIKDSAGIEFITQKKVTIFTGSTHAIVGARQRVKVEGVNLGTTTSAVDQVFELDDDYQDNTLQITINSITWELVDTFAFSGPDDQHYIVVVDQNKQSWVVFGDDIHGAIPPSGQTVFGTFYTCEGVNGNVEANTITEWDTPSGGPTPPTNVPAIDHYDVWNDLPAVGGQDEEGLEEIRKHAPLSLRTLDRAVTFQDHKDLCLLVPGVGKATALFEQLYKRITLYIAPEEGGTAPTQLLTDVEDFFEDKKMISTVIQALPAGETKIRMTITATVKFRRNVSQAESDIREALQDEFGFNNSSVNRSIRRSDIIALLDNLDKIDYLKLNVLTIKPYPRIKYGINPLEDNWYVEIQSTSVEIAFWRIAIITGSLARVWRTGPSGVESLEPTFVTVHATDLGNTDWTSEDGSLKLGIWGSFTVADEWTFKTCPYNEDQEIEDYTIPVYDINELDLTVNEQVGV